MFKLTCNLQDFIVEGFEAHLTVVTSGEILSITANHLQLFKLLFEILTTHNSTFDWAIRNYRLHANSLTAATNSGSSTSLAKSHLILTS